MHMGYKLKGRETEISQLGAPIIFIVVLATEFLDINNCVSIMILIYNNNNILLFWVQ